MTTLDVIYLVLAILIAIVAAMLVLRYARRDAALGLSAIEKEKARRE